MRTLTLAFLALITITLPLAQAQDPTGPLQDRAQAKTAAATGYPIGFVQDHANESAVAREAEWGVAYACYVVDYAHDEHGTPDPELDQCENYEEALGIEDEPKEDLPEAIAENLTEEPVGEAKALAEDAAQTAKRIAEGPTSALKETAEFVRRALAAVGRILTGALGILLLGLGTALQAATGLAEEVLDATALVGESLQTATRSTTTMANASLGVAETLRQHALGTFGAIVDAGRAAIGGLGSAVGEGLGAVGKAVSGAADAVAGAASSLGAAIADLVDLILGRPPGRSGAPEAPIDPDLPIDTRGLLPDAGRIVEHLT